jgi:colanic acid/amylovoran biosynthesis glycosyltransferase
LSARESVRIVYLVSLFPCWSETFIVREIKEMIRLGVDVRIVSLRHASETMVQSDAATLLDRVTYPVSWGQSLLGALGAILTHPVREAKSLALIGLGLRGHPGALAKSLVTWWRTMGLLSGVKALAPAHLHAHFATFPSTSALLLSERIGVPFSFTAHAHDIFLEDQLLAQKVGGAAFAVAISEFNRNYLREHVAGADRADIRIVHCGVSPAGFPFVTEGRDPRSILAVGRLDEIKGFTHLIDACGILHRKGVAFRCAIIGSGPLQSAIAAQIEAQGLSAIVQLLGARKQEEVRTHLYASGIFALPSVVTSRGDRDGIPVALMEAMACGMPVVSTRVSGIPELVEDGVTGLLAAPGDPQGLADCLERLLDEPALGERLALQARQRVEQEFDIGKEARKLHDAIANLP